MAGGEGEEGRAGGTGGVVVVGGINLDLKARSARAVQPGTSNPGTAHATPGGVGRNIAENLARLGTPIELVGRVGDDPAGATVLTATEDAGVGCAWVRVGPEPTGTYTAILDHDGELVAGIAAMAATDAITPASVEPALTALLPTAALLVLDGNLPTATVARGLELARDAGVPVVLDPVSAPKAALLRPVLDGSRPVHTITPDAHELRALSGEPDPEAAVADLHRVGVQTVWVSLGAAGSRLCRRDEPPHDVPACAVAPVEVTGAGDALVAGYVHGLVGGLEPIRAAGLGTRAALATIMSESSVRADLAAAITDSEEHRCTRC